METVIRSSMYTVRLSRSSSSQGILVILTDSSTASKLKSVDVSITLPALQALQRPKHTDRV